MHDTLEYIKADPIYRRFLHNTITFSLVYHYSENFLLPLSHDEVVHAKSPLVYKAPGDEWQKFATLRLLFGYMWAHPGKKLLFMGGEFAQTSEWNYAAELPWHLLQYPRHQGVQQWVKDLNTVYTSRPELTVLDYDPAGFEWIDCKDVDNSILIMMRKGKPELLLDADHAGLFVSADAGTQGPALVHELSQEELDRQQRAAAQAEASRPFCIFACNFTPIVRHGYAVGVPRLGRYREILNSDHRQYGGSGVINEGMFEAWQARIHERDQAIQITLPPLGVSVLELVKE
jgi:1,4-alpha-glucan branching enzyme